MYVAPTYIWEFGPMTRLEDEFSHYRTDGFAEGVTLERRQSLGQWYGMLGTKGMEIGCRKARSRRPRTIISTLLGAYK